MPTLVSVKVQIQPIRVNDATELFMQHLVSRNSPEGTLKNYRTEMDRLRRHAGNIYVHQLTPLHVDKIMGEHVERSNGPAARNRTISNLRVFFKWARRNKYVSPFDSDDPTDGWDREKYEPEQPPPIAHEHWPHLFDMAEENHPLHRAVFALGLYTFARASELAPLRMWDLKLTGADWTVDIRRKKTKLAADQFQMANELCEEITRWITWYNTWTIEHLGTPVRRDWYVIPRMRVSNRGQRFDSVRFYPHLGRHPGTLGGIVFPVLEKWGYPVRDAEGEKTRWGGAHALRRSGARAWYNELRHGEGRDFALRTVQAALGHKTQAQTEHYLGLNPDREFRNDMLRGKPMFASNDRTATPEGVTPLHQTAAFDHESALGALPAFFRQTA